MAQPLAKLLSRLSDNGVADSDVSGVELFGGSSRLEPLQEQLKIIADKHNIKCVISSDIVFILLMVFTMIALVID